jgi:hypothetical protein
MLLQMDTTDSRNTENAPKKKLYHTPKLDDLGMIRDVTLGGPSGMGDLGSGGDIGTQLP